jgi:hypothetical protein
LIVTNNDEVFAFGNNEVLGFGNEREVKELTLNKNFQRFDYVIDFSVIDPNIIFSTV